MNRVLAIVCTIALLSGNAWAAKKLDPKGPAITAYMEVNRGGRTKSAAKNMTEMHAQYHDRGYLVIDVDPYVEDGDLKGFFITYRKD